MMGQFPQIEAFGAADVHEFLPELTEEECRAYLDQYAGDTLQCYIDLLKRLADQATMPE